VRRNPIRENWHKRDNNFKLRSAVSSSPEHYCRFQFQDDREGELLASSVSVLSRIAGRPARSTTTGCSAAPVWSADGQKIAWQGNAAMYMRASSGTGPVETLREEPWIPDDSLPDDSGLLAHPNISPANVPRQIWLFPLVASHRTPRPVIEGRLVTTHARVSPDGRWVAFSNTDTRKFEVYVQNFPTAAGRWQVSTNGGLQPKWRRDGRELFYLALDGTLMAVPVALNALPEVGKPQPLFQTRIEATTGFIWHQYDLAPDGQRWSLHGEPRLVDTRSGMTTNRAMKTVSALYATTAHMFGTSPRPRSRIAGRFLDPARGAARAAGSSQPRG
jgi:hypothetical protein